MGGQEGGEPAGVPRRAPVVCGALGSFDPKRVEAIAAAFPHPPRSVHADARSTLLLDREPIRWQGDGLRGLGWIEGARWQLDGNVDGWRDAARLGAAGLVLDGRQRFLHTPVNGLAPIYWLTQGGAIYFASRIDPLVRTSPRRLSIDWDAWASIIAMRYPCGDRTPFAEVRRLGPSTTLRRRRIGGAKVTADRWPWAEVEPTLGLEQAVDSIVASLERTLEPYGDGLLCPLSGGRDSRTFFLALARESRIEAALTVSDDEGGTFEEDFAAPVAAALGVRHERLPAMAAEYPADWELRAGRVEHQFVDHAWLVPLARRLEDAPTAVPDGFAIDVFCSIGNHFYLPETLELGRPAAAAAALFTSLRHYGRGELALAVPFATATVARARESFMGALRPVLGAHGQPMLSLYLNRSLRGASSYSTMLLGDVAEVTVPGAVDAYVRAELGLAHEKKIGGALYAALAERLLPGASALPSTAGTPRSPRHLLRRWCSPESVAAHRERLATGPLAGRLNPSLTAWLDAGGEIELDPDLRMGLEAVSLLHSWWRRYRDVLGDVDPTDLLG